MYLEVSHTNRLAERGLDENAGWTVLLVHACFCTRVDVVHMQLVAGSATGAHGACVQEGEQDPE